jgi:hypothetical protein
LTSNIARNSSIGCSAIGPASIMPALLTRTSRCQPNACSRSRVLVTSSLSTRMVRPASLAASLSSVTCDQPRAVAMTWCPLRARSKATSLPKPLAAPVMRMVFDTKPLPGF